MNLQTLEEAIKKNYHQFIFLMFHYIEHLA